MADKDYIIPKESILGEKIRKKSNRLRILFRCFEEMKKKNSDKAIGESEPPYPDEMLAVIDEWIRDLEEDILRAVEVDSVGYVFEND